MNVAYAIMNVPRSFKSIDDKEKTRNQFARSRKICSQNQLFRDDKDTHFFLIKRDRNKKSYVVTIDDKNRYNVNVNEIFISMLIFDRVDTSSVYRYNKLLANNYYYLTLSIMQQKILKICMELLIMLLIMFS